MMESGSELCLDKFYPEKDLKIVNIRQQKDKIIIQMKSAFWEVLFITLVAG